MSGNNTHTHTTQQVTTSCQSYTWDVGYNENVTIVQI